MRVWRMRTGISITLKPADRRRLKALARDRNTPHKHVWRAEIVLLSADGVGTNEIMRRTGKTCVWRWQERFMVPIPKRSTSPRATSTLQSWIVVIDPKCPIREADIDP